MKILHINAVCGTGSTGRICVESCNYLDKSGNECYIAYSDGFTYKNGYKIGMTLEKKLHGLCSRIFGIQGYFSKSGTRKLLKYMDIINPDVVQLGNLHANYINLQILLSYLADKNIPTVVVLHDCWFYTGKCTHYTVDGCYKWKDNCGNCPRLKKDNPSWFFDRTAEMYKAKKKWFERIPRLAVVGVSDWITNEATKSLLSSAKIIKRIYNWIDLEVFSPTNTVVLRKKLNIEDKFIILGVSTCWSESKGLNKFLELSQIISEDMIIIMVGSMEHNICLSKNIIHIKETHNVNELVEYYSMADIFVNFSLEESFGKVTAEALACGTPVVTVNSTANPELIGKGCGYIIKSINYENILTLLRVIKKNGKSYYSQDCINYAQRNFDMHDRINEYVTLYKELTGIK